ncbi:MAG TPA: site-specific integrase [Conexibacter sp.]|nr:site-specific integrase [Conexibacter sp.]
MPRKPTGQVIERDRKRGRTFAVRFRAYGERHLVTLGTVDEGWTRPRAEQELENILADVRRGIWQPPHPDVVDAAPAPRDPTFHEFASEWFEGVELGLKPRTRVDYRWRLSNHLLPYFAGHRLSAITVEEVDRYRRAKERERAVLERARAQQVTRPPADRERLARPLSNGSINKTIRLLAQVLQQAVEYGLVDRNPATGKRRMLREAKPSRSYLQPAQVKALLAASHKLDEEARHGDAGRRWPLLATLVLAGLRISEALDLRWRDVNLAARKLHVRDAKTEAGVREVDLTPYLQEVLAEYRTRTRHAGPDGFVFATSTGERDNPSNVRNRFLAAAVERANVALEDAGGQPIGHVTPHSLRRTFASLLLASGADVPYVMAQLGHADPKMTLGVYAKVIASKTDHGAELDGLVGAADWAPSGTTALGAPTAA